MTKRDTYAFSRFAPQMVVRARVNAQGLREGHRYTVRAVRIDWLFGNGYTTLSVTDEDGNRIDEIGNPQIVFDIL